MPIRVHSLGILGMTLFPSFSAFCILFSLRKCHQACGALRRHRLEEKRRQKTKFCGNGGVASPPLLPLLVAFLSSFLSVNVTRHPAHSAGTVWKKNRRQKTKFCGNGGVASPPLRWVPHYNSSCNRPLLQKVEMDVQKLNTQVQKHLHGNKNESDLGRSRGCPYVFIL